MGSGVLSVAEERHACAFEIYIANDGTAEVYTDENYKDSNKARYADAFNAIIPEAIRQAQLTRAAAQKPRR